MQQVFSCFHSRREIEPADQADSLTVKLFRIRGIDIVSAKARFHMSHRDLQIITGQRGGKGGRGIPVNQHHIRFFLLQNRPDPFQNQGSDIKECLALMHHLQIIVCFHLKNIQHLIQHLTMLSGDTNFGLDVVMFLKFQHHRTHLDRLRPGTENYQDLFHNRYVSSADMTFRVSRTALSFRRSG